MELTLDKKVKEVTRPEKTDSIEINKNSKGYTWSVKAYGDSLPEIQSKIDAYIKYAESIASGEALGEQWKLTKAAIDKVNNEPDAFQQEVTLEEVNRL